MIARRSNRSWHSTSIACVASTLVWVALLLPAVALAQAPGDVDCNGIADTADAHAMIRSLFGDAPPCGTTDVNGDAFGSSADLTAIVLAIAAPAPEGPSIGYFGLAGASGIPISEFGFVGNTPLFLRSSGSGFKIVIEAAPGANGLLPGRTTARLDDPTQLPDLQIGCNRPLGDGSPMVCSGGVPAILPPHFVIRPDTTRTLNDFGCLFDSFTASSSSCTIDSFGNPSFRNSSTRLQLCLQLSRDREFPPGDTLCSVRVRDIAGNPGRLASFLVRVGGEPSPPTFTPTFLPTSSPTPTRSIPATSTPTRTPTVTRSPTTVAPVPTATFATTATITRSPTSQLSRTSTPTLTPTTTAASPTTATPTRTPTPSATGIASATRTATGTIASTSTPTITASRTSTATASRVPTATPTPSNTRTSTHTRTPTRTPTPTSTQTVTATATHTRTPTRTPTATPTGLRGPFVSFFGLARADESLVNASGSTPSGVPIYERPFGSGFRIVVEGHSGPSGFSPGNTAFQFGSAGFPDLQVLSSRPLGNGSAAVCDRIAPEAGGVPAIDPPNFTNTGTVIAAVNDLGCRFLDGGGNPFGRIGSDNSCVQFPPNSGTFRYVSTNSTIQFCGLVDSAFAFAPGDTMLTVRLRDILGNAGPPSQIVVRITGTF